MATTKIELDLIANLLKLHPEEEESNPKQDAPPSEKDKPYADLSNSEAILLFLRGRGNEFTSPAEVRKALLAGGVTTNSARFENVVFNELKRLVKREQLEADEDPRSGYFAYRIKQPA